MESSTVNLEVAGEGCMAFLWVVVTIELQMNNSNVDY